MNLFTKILVSIILLSVTSRLYSVNYTSAAAGPSSWNNATTWIPNGIPTGSDNVTIAAGHTVNFTSSGICKNLTVNGTLTLNNNLVVSGNYTLTGTETGSGNILFNALGGCTLTISGTTSSLASYSFNTNTTISAGSIINKSVNSSAYVILAVNKTMTNLGNCTFGPFTGKAGSTFINGANASLTLLKSGFMTGANFVASAAGNNVNIKYTTGALPMPTAAGYYNLTLSATTAGTKTLPSNTIVAHNITMNANNNLNSNNFDISVGGNWTNNATFTASSGKTVTFNGSASQNVSNTVGTTTFKGLTINNNFGVTLTTGTYILDEVLTVSNGTFNTGGRSFTMTSNAARTARIAPITGSGAIAGNFTIQRFITTRDSTWSDLSSPVQNSTFNDWDLELPAIYYGYSPPTDYPTQYTYDEAADDFSPVTSSGTALTPGQGFEVFLTGDYSYSNLPNTTITTVGVPNQIDQDLSSLVSFNGAGSNLVGNPFASSINWSDVFTASSGIENTYDMYDYTAGNYSTYGLGTEIGSGQGFWVYANAASPTLIIPESAKSTSSNSSIKAASNESYFTLKLSSNDANNNYFHILKISADNVASDGWDSNDHLFRKSPNKLAPSIYSAIDGKKAVINSFNLSDDNFSMPVSVSAGINGYYKIEANGFENISEYTCVQLEDKTTNRFFNLSNGQAYSFELKTTDNADRFVLHLSKTSDCSTKAPVITASALGNNVTVLPTSDGNSISFKMEEATPATITVTNVMGQKIIESLSVIAETQTANIVLPQDFSGIYILKIESSKGVITKKYIRK